jgi:phage terminase small subunit
LRERSAVRGPEPCLPAKYGIEIAPGRLTARQERFVHEYPKDCNGTQAAIRAGYAEKGADVQATRLLDDRRILRQLREVQGRVLRRVDVTSERVVREYAAIGFFDPAELFDDAGRLLPVGEMPLAARHAISGIEVEERCDGEGRPTGVLRKIRFAPKAPALNALALHLGIARAPECNDDRRMTVEDIRVMLRMWEQEELVREAQKLVEDELEARGVALLEAAPAKDSDDDRELES